MTALTPDEAKQQLCPPMRYCVNEDRVYQHGESAVHHQAACQGPDCKIGWRWVYGLTVDNPQRAFAADGNQLGQQQTKARGYCGFAGEPR